MALELTRWLEMVWTALSEPDQEKREILLKEADDFIEERRQQFSREPIELQ